MVTRGVLVVGAHPDDEVLIAGGTLASCAAAGVPTGVLCLTRGEKGPIADPAVATPQTLGDVRVAELQASCAQLGVSYIECWQQPDGNLRWANRGAIVGQLALFLQMRRPEAVITFGEDGLYHHPDHVAVHELAVRAVQTLEKPPALYRSVWPKSVMRELARALDQRGLASDLWELEPEDFGTEDMSDSFAIDVTPSLERKLAALMAHRSQVPDSHVFAKLDRELLHRFLGTEWFAPLNGQHPGWLSRVVGDG
jgi:N-acetyl-1-D-myo-inositol-2-amino-2-deoxy-alpha-D-glucopyranoside deacetylase